MRFRSWAREWTKLERCRMTMRQSKWTHTGIALAALSLFLAGCAARGDRTEVTLSQQVEHATSRADHEALAQRYDAKAEASRREAADHRALLASYSAGTQYRWVDRLGPPNGMRAMPQHCEQLIRNAEEDARIYSEIADTHRALARQAADQPPPSERRD